MRAPADGPAVRDGRRPTLRDVAARAGVSFKTVSRVVNGEPGVSALLVQRVEQAVEELNFRPHLGARTLRRTDARSSSIGLLLEDVSNPYSAAVQRAVEDVATAQGVVVFSASLDESAERERVLVRDFVSRRADGLLLVPAGDDQSYLAPEIAAGTAVVCVDREPHGLAVDAVVATNTAGAADAVRHLAASGHRRIAFLGDSPAIVTARQRHAGYREALDALGLPVDPTLAVHGLGHPDVALDAVLRLLERPDPPTAIFAAQNLVTIGAVRALRRAGREHDVALVGFDDFLMADLLDPAVTVVAQDAAAIGTLAAELLFDRIAGTAAAPPTTYAVPTHLVVRGSGEIPA